MKSPGASDAKVTDSKENWPYLWFRNSSPRLQVASQGGLQRRRPRCLMALRVPPDYFRREAVISWCMLIFADFKQLRKTVLWMRPRLMSLVSSFSIPRQKVLAKFWVGKAPHLSPSEKGCWHISFTPVLPEFTTKVTVGAVTPFFTKHKRGLSQCLNNTRTSRRIVVLFIQTALQNWRR